MAGAGLVFAASPVQAGPAESVHFGGVDNTMTAGYADTITVDLRDAGSVLDAGYTGTVVFSATGTDCTGCFTITPNNGAGNEKKYTFTPGDSGVKNFSITWTVAGDDRALKVTAPVTSPAPAEVTDTATVDVTAQTATTVNFDSTGEGAVDDTPDIGVNDLVTVSLRNPLGDIDTGYAGTLNWDNSTCADDFLVNGGPSSADYTFVPSDQGAKTFNITWTDTAQTPSGCTLVVEATTVGPPPGTATDTESGIEPTAVPPTTTTVAPTTTSSSTTSTTVPNLPHIDGAIVTGALAPGGPHVRVFKAADRSMQREFFAYSQGFKGGVNVALGDVNGDNWTDIVTGAGPGGGSHVKVFSGRTGLELASFFAYPVGFNGGVFVASADVNNDGRDDIVTGTDGGGGPHVKVFSGAAVTETGYNGAESGPSILGSFFAYSTNPVFLGGVRVGAADADGDGKAEVITGAGIGGGPHVAIFKPGVTLGTRTLVAERFAYGESFTGGIFVGATNLGSTFRLITGAGPGGGQHVRVFDASLAEVASVVPQVGTIGARVALGNADADGAAEYAVGHASGAPNLRLFNLPAEEIGTVSSAYSNFGGGISVAVGDI